MKLIVNWKTEAGVKEILPSILPDDQAAGESFQACRESHCIEGPYTCSEEILAVATYMHLTIDV